MLHLPSLSFLSGYFSCFHLLVTVNNTAVDIGVHVPVRFCFEFYCIYTQK